ncbi:MAG: hypothetical protein PHI50_00155 [Alphaproteobacteria bacterium]|nr:hypothetical protein [Alphaproteobacteria bacterium]
MNNYKDIKFDEEFQNNFNYSSATKFHKFLWNPFDSYDIEHPVFSVFFNEVRNAKLLLEYMKINIDTLIGVSEILDFEIFCEDGYRISKLKYKPYDKGVNYLQGIYADFYETEFINKHQELINNKEFNQGKYIIAELKAMSLFLKYIDILVMLEDNKNLFKGLNYQEERDNLIKLASLSYGLFCGYNASSYASLKKIDIFQTLEYEKNAKGGRKTQAIFDDNRKLAKEIYEDNKNLKQGELAKLICEKTGMAVITSERWARKLRKGEPLSKKDLK